MEHTSLFLSLPPKRTQPPGPNLLIWGFPICSSRTFSTIHILPLANNKVNVVPEILLDALLHGPGLQPQFVRARVRKLVH